LLFKGQDDYEVVVDFDVCGADDVRGRQWHPSQKLDSLPGGMHVGQHDPLFGGGPTATYYAVSAANKNYAKALEDLHATRLQALGSLESSWSGFAQAEDQVRVQRAFLDSAIQRKQESDIMYQNGLMSYQDWQLIMNDYVNFQKSYLSAEQNLISAEGQWRFATGQQLGESR